jgi:hypothetical protein
MCHWQWSLLPDIPSDSINKSLFFQFEMEIREIFSNEKKGKINWNPFSDYSLYLFSVSLLCVIFSFNLLRFVWMPKQIKYLRWEGVYYFDFINLMRYGYHYWGIFELLINLYLKVFLILLIFTLKENSLKILF